MATEREPSATQERDEGAIDDFDYAATLIAIKVSLDENTRRIAELDNHLHEIEQIMMRDERRLEPKADGSAIHRRDEASLNQGTSRRSSFDATALVTLVLAGGATLLLVVLLALRPFPELLASTRLDSLAGTMAIMAVLYGAALLIHRGLQQRRATALVARRREVVRNEREVLEQVATSTRERLEG